MAELLSLREGVAAVVSDGDAVALEGFTHLIPFAAGHELLRQGRRDLASLSTQKIPVHGVTGHA